MKLVLRAEMNHQVMDMKLLRRKKKYPVEYTHQSITQERKDL